MFKEIPMEVIVHMGDGVIAGDFGLIDIYSNGAKWYVPIDVGQIQFDAGKYVTSVAYSPEGKRVASGSWNNKVQIWDVER